MFKKGDRVLIYEPLLDKWVKGIILELFKNSSVKGCLHRVAIIGEKKSIFVTEEKLRRDVIASMKNGAWRNAGKN